MISWWKKKPKTSVCKSRVSHSGFCPPLIVCAVRQTLQELPQQCAQKNSCLEDLGAGGTSDISKTFFCEGKLPSVTFLKDARGGTFIHKLN